MQSLAKGQPCALGLAALAPASPCLARHCRGCCSPIPAPRDDRIFLRISSELWELSEAFLDGTGFGCQDLGAGQVSVGRWQRHHEPHLRPVSNCFEQRDAPGTGRSLTLLMSDTRRRPPQHTWQQATKGAWYTETGRTRQPALHRSTETCPGQRPWTAPTRAATVKQPRRALAAREAAAWTAPTRYARQTPQTMRCHAAHARHTRVTKHASALALLSTRLRCTQSINGQTPVQHRKSALAMARRCRGAARAPAAPRKAA